MNYHVQIKSISRLTHDTLCLRLSKPHGYRYGIGQAIEVAIDNPGYEQQFRPFTLTSLPFDPYLELIVKVYPDHGGFTQALSRLGENGPLIITAAWDSYDYRGEGVFIAAGSGITPFIPMIRQLSLSGRIPGHTLLYANKTEADIIHKQALNKALGSRFINILSREYHSKLDYGRLDQAYLKDKVSDFSEHFYICGPEAFSGAIKGYLINQGAAEAQIQIGY
ncbi:FAD-binding oxidoreductase [Robiginitalea biformata]|nr:FAD-binding oxidoreductase [Robiginitalea biformata]